MNALRWKQLAAVILALGAGAACPSARGAPVPEQALAPPILALVGEREALSLTGAQLVALDSIQRRWSAEEERLTVRGTIFNAGPLGVSTERRAIAPSGREARANHSRAARAVEAVLTPEQRAAVCELRWGRRADRMWPWCTR